MKAADADVLTDVEVQRFFDRANTLRGDDDARNLYTDWAPIYDGTVERFGAYLAPGRVAEMLSAAAIDREAPILDVACGSGVSGRVLWQSGFRNIVGLDLTPAMLERAAEKKVYRELVVANLYSALPFNVASFAAVTCVGVFALAHVRAEALANVLEVLKPGGVLACDIELSSWDHSGFATAFADLEKDGALASVERHLGRCFDFEPKDEQHAWFVTAKKAARA